MTTRVLLVRHGETDWNAAGRWQGHAPVPLNQEGLTQSTALGQYLAQNGYRIDALFSSDLKRAMQTAGEIAAPLGLSIQADPRLREVDLGEWQGLTHGEAEAWDPVHYAAFRADYYTVPPPNGESRNALKVRVRAGFDDIIARHREQTVVLVSHGGTLGMLIESLFGKIERPTLSNTSMTVVEQSAPDAAWDLVRVAWAPHLHANALGETW
jgi:broad specificity phosphatase PhoE